MNTRTEGTVPSTEEISESRSHPDTERETSPDDQSTTPELSVVIPVLNESENVRPLQEEIRRALDDVVRYEIIFVDDGSTDATAEIVRECMRDGNVRLLRHSTRSGQSAAMRTGVRAAKAPWIATLDGDRQNDPSDLPRLWELSYRDPAAPALVMGYRMKREDSLVKRASSRIANYVRRSFLADDCPDSGCGIRIFEREAFLDLPWFDHMHRFLPALFQANGYKVVSAPVNHRPRQQGVSKYGVWDRLWVGIVDLFGVMWLRKRSRAMLKVSEEKETQR